MEVPDLQYDQDHNKVKTCSFSFIVIDKMINNVVLYQTWYDQKTK